MSYYFLPVFLVLCTSYNLQAANHNIEWTRDGVQQYPPSDPLQVAPGDILVFKCNTGSYSNMWSQLKLEQYEDCDCAAAASVNDMNDGCDEENRFFECFGLARNISVQIVRNSEVLGSARDFAPGNTYYFISYSDGVEATDAISSRGSGGECIDTDEESGLKMAMFVRENDDNNVIDTTEVTPHSETDRTDTDSLTPDETVPIVGVPDGNDDGGDIISEQGSASGISNVGGLNVTDSATSSVVCTCSTLILLVFITLLSLVLS